MEIENNQRTNSYDDQQLVSETSLSSDRELKADAASGNPTKISTTIQTLSLKIAVSVKCQNSLVIQVCKNMSCFSCYFSLTICKGGEIIVRLLKGAFSYRTCYRLHWYCRSALLMIGNLI